MTNEAIRDLSEEVTREDMRAVREIELALLQQKTQKLEDERKAKVVARQRAQANQFIDATQRKAEAAVKRKTKRSAAYRALQERPAIYTSRFYDVVVEGGSVDCGNRWRILRGTSSSQVLSIQHFECGGISFGETDVVNRFCSKCKKAL